MTMPSNTRSCCDTAEPMIDAREASYAMNLPYYWFADQRMRALKRIPHYVLCGSLRFRLSELQRWQELHAARSDRQSESPEVADE